MLHGQVAVFLSCSEKFRPGLAWPVRDALAAQGLRVIMISEAPPLGAPSGEETSAEPYLDASSAFVALCTADYELSDGSKYPRANIIDEIQEALGRPQLRDHAQVLKSPGVLLPSDITPTYDSLDVTKPAVAAEVILKQLQQWGIVPVPESPAAAPHRVGSWEADDVDALLTAPRPATATRPARGSTRCCGTGPRTGVAGSPASCTARSWSPRRRAGCWPRRHCSRRWRPLTRRWCHPRWSRRWLATRGIRPGPARRTCCGTGRRWRRSTFRSRCSAGWPCRAPRTGSCGRPPWPRSRSWPCTGARRTRSSARSRPATTRATGSRLPRRCSGLPGSGPPRWRGALPSG